MKNAITAISATQSADRIADRGFALIVVIWILALLAVLAAGVASDSGSEAVIARNRLASAQARAAADAGIALAIEGLLDPNPQTQWRSDGSARDVQYAGAAITVTVQDEGGKIDLNTAPPELIGGLLDEFSVSPEEHAAIVKGILDRRNQVAASTSPVAGRFFFSSIVSTSDFSKLPFADVSELRLVPGVTHGTYDRISPYLTVYAASPTINPMTAPREDLLGIPNINPQEVDFFLADRQAAASSAEKPSLSGVDNYVRVGILQAVTIIAKATTQDGAFFAREAVVTISPGFSIAPYRILRWTQFPEPAAGDELKSLH